MPQDLPPSGGYEPVQYKVRSWPRNPPIDIHELRIGQSPNLTDPPSNGNERDSRRISANEGLKTEKPSRAGIPTECYAVCGRGSGDLWVLESWEGDSGTEVRLALSSFRITSQGYMGIRV